MRLRFCLGVLFCLGIIGCGPQPAKPSGQVLLTVNDYELTKSEFDEGFAQSPYADRQDKVKARSEYMENLIDQKLILLDAQKRNIDKTPDFLRTIEHFWEQSLITVALGTKTRDINKSVVLSEEELRRFYESMVKEGITTRSYDEVYPQIKRQAMKQMESRLLNEWMKDLRSKALISVDRDLLKQGN